jgi:Na+/proline symporter
VASTWRRACVVALFLAGVLVFSDIGALAWAGFCATIALLVAIGFIERRLRAFAWAGMLVASAFVADVLWQLDWEPFNRSDEDEAIPQTPFVFIALPIPIAIIGLGVAAGSLWRRTRSRSAKP